VAEPDIQGVCPPHLEPVREAFAANFAEGLELGARFAVALEGEIVLDLMGGFADRAMTRPFGPDVLAPVFSTTKAMTAVMIAHLASQGRLDYRQPVAEIWPEFGQAGKTGITIEQCLSHQDGLAAFMEPIDPGLWFDWDGVCAGIAGMAPLWPPGTASGYHPSTFGYIAGEIFRRVDARSIGRALHEDFAAPLGLDLWIGLPSSEDPRCAEMRRPPGPPDLGELTELKRAAFLQPWSSPTGRDGSAWRRAETPSANGHATAPALARLLALIACDGRLDGRQVLAPGLAAEASRERITGPDLVLPFTLSWAAGLLRNPPNLVFGPSQVAVGHYGWGGSCVMADPERRLSAAYVMNRQSIHLIGDPRPVRLFQALYEAL
jgi:CubicO group peptidase (beta-lactamase class C family)